MSSFEAKLPDEQLLTLGEWPVNSEGDAWALNINEEHFSVGGKATSGHFRFVHSVHGKTVTFSRGQGSQDTILSSSIFADVDLTFWANREIVATVVTRFIIGF